jgi:hypothetical protein
LAPSGEPFRFEGKGGLRVDLLIAPGGSRDDPPRLGQQQVLEVPGSRLAFALPPERITVRLQDEVEILVPGLAGALVLKTVLLEKGRPIRVRDDARDVAALLRIARRESKALLRELRKHKRWSDVRATRRALGDLFGEEKSRGTQWVAQEKGTRAALTAVADAHWLLDELGQ